MPELAFTVIVGTAPARVIVPPENVYPAALKVRALAVSLPETLMAYVARRAAEYGRIRAGGVGPRAVGGAADPPIRRAAGVPRAAAAAGHCSTFPWGPNTKSPPS